MKEKRECKRFRVPDATLVYKVDKFLFSDKAYSERAYPIIDLSKGGLRFMCDRSFRKNTKLSMKISIPGEKAPMTLKGRVIWCMFSPVMGNKYQIGIQLETYGKGKHMNDPRNLEKISDLEKEYLGKEEIIYDVCTI